jgi:hypothetical protein
LEISCNVTSTYKQVQDNICITTHNGRIWVLKAARMKIVSSGCSRVVWYKTANISKALAAFIIMALIALMREAAKTSGTQLNFYQTT